MFDFKSKKILIVDDQKTFHIMIKSMLSNQGAKNIKFAESAEAAVRLAGKIKFDIFLVDYSLGVGKSGLEFLNYLRLNKLIKPSAIFVLISGDNSKGMVLTAIEKTPDDYLTKPFSQVQLVNRLTKAIRKKEVLVDIIKETLNKNYPEAIKIAKEKIKTQPLFQDVLTNILAALYVRTKQYEEAEQILKPLADRELIRASITLGKVYFLQEKYDKAIKLLTTVIQNNPLQMDPHQWLARSYQKEGQLEKALKILHYTANLTHSSVNKHEEVALLATEMNDYSIMVSSYNSILQLSRHSFFPDPCHLANYIRCIINHAKLEKNMEDRKEILKKVNSIIYQARFEEGKLEDFNFACFDELCQAKVHLALNEPLRAKRRILKTLHTITFPINEIDNACLYESISALLDIGEFELATPYLDELKGRNILNRTTQLTITENTGDTLEKRIEKFKHYNQLGISNFENEQFSDALINFEKAIELEPLNSGALLNRINVFLELIKENSSKTRSSYYVRCDQSLKLLTNIQLSSEHKKRFDFLSQGFSELNRRR